MDFPQVFYFTELSYSWDASETGPLNLVLLEIAIRRLGKLGVKDKKRKVTKSSEAPRGSNKLPQIVLPL